METRDRLGRELGREVWLWAQEEDLHNGLTVERLTLENTQIHYSCDSLEARVRFGEVGRRVRLYATVDNRLVTLQRTTLMMLFTHEPEAIVGVTRV